MGKRNAYDYRRNRKKERRKQWKHVIVRNPLVNGLWDSRISMKANYEKMGLLFDPNETAPNKEVGGIMVSGAETNAIKELKNVSKLKESRSKYISEDDRIFCIYMLELYGDNYDGMSSDSRNVYQLTAPQIRRLITAFKISKHYPQYLSDRKNNNLNALELFD